MKRSTMIIVGLVAVLALTVSACSSKKTGGDQAAPDTAYPGKDLRLVVQAKAGGGSDTASRALASAMEPLIGTSIVVENRPGASGSTAMLFVKEQPADGYTIGFGPVEISMLGSMNFDIKPSDYDLIAQIMLGPGVISVPANSPHSTLADLVAAAKAKSLTVANSGPGSIWELAAKGLAKASGAQFTHVPFDGGAPAAAAVLGGQVDAAITGTNEVKQNLADGKVKVLAIFHSQRHPALPDVPTAKEAGYDLEFGGWGGIYAPKGLPAPVKAKLESSIKAATESPAYKDIIEKGGNLVVYKNSADFTAFAEAEFNRFGALING